MVIKPSTCLRNDYNKISEFCKREHQPVFLTKNGEGDLVVMSIEDYTAREEMLKLKAELLASEEEWIRGGRKTYTLDELKQHMEDVINGAEELQV